MRSWRFALVLLFLTVLLRSPALPWPALEEDEACHFTGAVTIAEGGKPYQDVVDGKTPLLWYLFAIVVKIAGPFNSTAHRLFTDLTVWVSALLIWWLGAIIHNKRAGRWGALLFTLFSTTSSYKILASNYELHLLPFDIFAYCAFALTIARRQAIWALLAGASIATSFFIKQTAGINLATQSAILLLLLFLPDYRKLALKSLGCLVVGFIGAIAAYAGWMASLGVLDQMLFWSWSYAWILTAKSAAALPVTHRMIGRLGAWLLGTLAVHLWASKYLIDLIRRWRNSAENWTTERIVSLTLILWALFEWLPISLGGRFPPHYFLMYLPPISLLAGLWIGERCSLRDYFSLARLRQPAPFVRFLILFFLPVLGTFVASWNVEWGNRLFHLHRADHARLAARIQQETAEDDRIFVWGHNPEFYVYAKRRPASRFLFLDFVTGRHGIPSKYMKDPRDYDAFAIEAAWPMLFADFAEHPPKLIIDTSPADLHDYQVFPLSRYPALHQYVSDHYALAWIEDDVHFYLRKTASLSK